MYKKFCIGLFLFCLFKDFELHCSFAKRTMKILVVVDVFPAAIQTFILNQIIGLIEYGHDVQILAARDKPYGIPGDYISPDVLKYNLLSKVRYINFYQENNQMLLRVLIDINSFDILLCQFGHIGEIFSALKKNYAIKGKLVTCFRGADASFLKIDHQRYANLFRYGDLFLPVCEYFGDILKECGCPADRIKVHHSSIHCGKFIYKEREKIVNGEIRIVTVARIVREKGLEYSVRAVAQLKNKYPNIRYFIIGSGNYEKRLQKLIDDLGMHRNIVILGFKAQEEISHILHNSHIFILTPIANEQCIFEGIPNALMEAMASGIPVISTYHSGIPELIRDKQSGFLVKEKSVKMLADKIEYLIKHSELWPILTLAGRKHVEKEFNMSNTNKKLEQRFFELLEGND